MAAIPRIKKSDIIHWTDNVYFQRREKYYEQGAIYDQRRQGMMLKSECSGSQTPFYRQKVLFNSKGIESAECSSALLGGRTRQTYCCIIAHAGQRTRLN